MKLAQVTLDFAQEAIDKQVPGTANLDAANHASGFGPLMSSIFSFVMLIAAILVLFYLIWGAFEWITSAGDKGKLEKARQRISSAVLGIIVLGSVVAIFMIVQQFLGITVFTFIGSSGSTSGGASSGGSGGGAAVADGACVVDGSLLNDGGVGNYCTQGAAIVKCYPPEGSYLSNHYNPCSCVDGSQYERPGYTFGCS